MSIEGLSQQARQSSIYMAALATDTKNQALALIRDALRANSGRIVEENRKDLAQAEKDNLAAPLLKRLIRNENHVLHRICDD